MNDNVHQPPKHIDCRMLALNWDEGIGKSPDLCQLIPVSRGHQELLTLLTNTGIRQTRCWKQGIRAQLRPKLPIIDFVIKRRGKEIKRLPYHAMIDDQGCVTLIETFDNAESFKILAESKWEPKSAPLTAAAEIAITVVASVETHQKLARLMRDLNSI